MNKRKILKVRVALLMALFLVGFTAISLQPVTAGFGGGGEPSQRSMTTSWVTKSFRVYTDSSSGVEVDGWISMQATIEYYGVEPAEYHYTYLQRLIVKIRWYVPYYYSEQYANYSHINFYAYDTSNAPCPSTCHHFTYYFFCPSHIDTGGGYYERHYYFNMEDWFSPCPYWGEYNNNDRLVTVSFAKDYYNCNDYPGRFFYWHRAWVHASIYLDDYITYASGIIS